MSARNGMLPLSTATSSTPSGYASEISRPTPSARSCLEKRTRASGDALLEVILQRDAQHRRPQSLAELGQLAEGLDCLHARLRVALLHHRHDDLLEEAR